MLTPLQKSGKRALDIIISLIGLLILLFPLILLLLVAGFDTRMSGLFSQTRIGYKGRPFKLYKIRSLKGVGHMSAEEIRKSETAFGKWLRKTKIDEIPQLYNVLKGDMSLVGPRPDLPGYADNLSNEDKIILKVKPGITGPATLKYRNEEEILRRQIDPKKFNDTIIWPDKVEINKEYVRNWSFKKDLEYIYKSILS